MMAVAAQTDRTSQLQVSPKNRAKQSEISAAQKPEPSKKNIYSDRYFKKKRQLVISKNDDCCSTNKLNS